MGIIERAVEMAESEAKVAEGVRPPSPDVAAERMAREPAREAIPAQPDASFEVAAPIRRDTKALIHIDLVRLSGLGRLPAEEAARQTGEEMRRIKWPLLRHITGRAGATPVRNNVIVVTSALPGEGKTFVAFNLALSIVRDREMQVALVDGDVARPGLTAALSLEGCPGLNDVLEDLDRDINSVTYETDVEGLLVVPAGKWHEQASELFAGSRMPRVMDALIRRVGHGVIILDSPPLLATNEAQVMTRHAGQVLVVVRADETEQRVVREAVALIDESASISAVLNGVRPSALRRYYGEYHYGYGSRSRDEAPGSRHGERAPAHD